MEAQDVAQTSVALETPKPFAGKIPASWSVTSTGQFRCPPESR
jgi:hypothetical protein